MYCVIMAGGSGTRFWPLSRKGKPKQLLNIMGYGTMLQITVDRLKRIPFVKKIFIVAGPELAKEILGSTKGISKDNLIIEPSGKNTAPCIGLAALEISKLQEDAVMGVFSADHLIENHSKFIESVRTAYLMAQKKKTVVTLGITPTFPSTGYGYIQYEKESNILLTFGDNTPPSNDVFPLKAFVEKPDKDTAKSYVSGGEHLWNSGMFIWRVDVLLTLFKTHMPELNENLERIKKLLERSEDISTEWNGIISQSIDYGIMERLTSNSYVLKAGFDWADVGSWKALHDILPKDDENNAIQGNGVVVSGKNNVIYSKDHFTSVVGLENIVVVHTEDATLVVHKEKAEEVKNLVESLSKIDREDLQ